MDVQITLCDWAEVLNNKLYIMGAGWNRVIAGQPFTLALGIHVSVEWTETNTQHDLQIRLLDADGNPVIPALPPGLVQPPGVDLQPIVIPGKFEVGRPVGTRQGEPQPALSAFRIPVLILNPGQYAFQVDIDGNPTARVSFEAVAGPAPT